MNAVVSRQDSLVDAAVNASLALFTAARRYCIERHAYWCERYSKIARQRDGYDYTPEALATFPRYNVLNAIRVELERLEPAQLGDVDNTRALLVLAGKTAEDDFTRRPIGEIDQRAMTEERKAFCDYMLGLPPDDLDTVQSLPYRRVLAPEESKAVWARLRGKWQIKQGYWYPLVDCQFPDVVAFQTRAFVGAVQYDALREVLKARRIERVWELREYGPEYMEDVALFDPHYNGAEGFWSSGDLDWIIYASHESSVTVGGWLLSELKVLWPSWKAHVWTGILE